MKVSLVQVPYHLGHPSVRPGLGPARYLERGADRALRQQGHDVEVHAIQLESMAQQEIGATFALNKLLAERVGQLAQQRQFPLVLAGDCNSCLGTLAGLAGSDVGLIWFDAHGDFNTPESTVSGFLDGMALAAATGNCWKGMTAQIPHFRPVREEWALLVGVRALDPREKVLLEQSRVSVVPAESLKRAGIRAGLEQALTALKHRVREVYLHIDIDALDPAEAPATDYAVPGGLTLGELEQAIRLIARHVTLRAAALTAFNPTCDHQDKTAHAGLRLMSVIVEAARDKGRETLVPGSANPAGRW
jgi:arginase